MATPTPTRQTARRASRAHSITSDASHNTSYPTPSPPPARRGRGVREASVANDPANTLNSLSPAPQTPQKSSSKLPAHYYLAPTVPSPFSGTLDASLDAVLEFSQMYGGIKGVSRIVTTLLEEPNPATIWSDLLNGISDEDTTPLLPTRYIITELFFLLTRTLLPEQITENRAALARMYDRKKQLAIRLVLRYDMLREWKTQPGNYAHRDQVIAVSSVPPAPLLGSAISSSRPAVQYPIVSPAYQQKYPFRRPLMPNIVPTLIAAPAGGFTTHGVRERMKHHVTELDGYLVVTDEQVEAWSEQVLKMKTCMVLMHWQWLRRNNAFLEDMEVCGWEELEGKAEECEWFAEDGKRSGGGNAVKKETKALGQGI